jgi:anaerobic dimethyl sulfoxide reductase subunit B (iron-sulfur subunit)
VREFCGGSWKADDTDPTLFRQEGVFIYHVSVSCNHCEMPACLGVCPAVAITKDSETGIVSIDYEACIGCEACYEACPYKAPQIDQESKKPVKCDFCKALLEKGEQPACVATCPMRVLQYGDYDELVDKHGNVCDVAPLPSSKNTRPSLILSLHREAKQNADEGYSTSLYVSDR